MFSSSLGTVEADVEKPIDRSASTLILLADSCGSRTTGVLQSCMQTTPDLVPSAVGSWKLRPTAENIRHEQSCITAWPVYGPVQACRRRRVRRLSWPYAWRSVSVHQWPSAHRTSVSGVPSPELLVPSSACPPLPEAVKSCACRLQARRYGRALLGSRHVRESNRILTGVCRFLCRRVRDESACHRCACGGFPLAAAIS